MYSATGESLHMSLHLQQSVLCVHLLVQHLKQLVEYILAQKVSCLCRLILGHGGEE